MRAIWIVLWHEIKITLFRPSFWFATVGIPLFALGFYAVIGISAGSQMEQFVSKMSSTQHAGVKPAGLVDLSGMITRIPASIPPGAVRQFDDLAAAEQALQAGEIEPLAVIPADYTESRQMTMMMREYTTMGTLQGDLFAYLLAYNLVGDEALARKLIDPTQGMETHSLAPDSGTANNPIQQFAPLATLFIFISLLTMSSGWMLHSVSREKVNRTAEVLLLSLDPRQLMTGKIIGLSVVAFIQMLIWSGGGMMLGSGVNRLLSEDGLSLPQSFLWWSAVYFLFGYLLYASLLGAVGAMAPNQHDDGYLAFLISMPLGLPMLVFSAFVDAPSGPLVTALSLFPLTAPTTMPARLASASVPAWQIAASLMLLALATLGAVNLSARAFRTDRMLAGGPVGWDWLAAQVKQRRDSR